MSEQKSSYPSPTAAQTRGGAGPYHPPPSSEGEQDDSNLRAQLQNEIEQGTGNHAQANGPYGHGQPEHNYTAPMFPNMGGYHQPMNLADAQVTPTHPGQHHHPMVNAATSHLKEVGGEDSAKKKSKVTRACDECRRKKIKCDADADAAGLGTQCSNCKRTNSECLFSKPAQKRGPSRGYIRDLSDRVADLEQQKRARDGHNFSPLHTPIQGSPLAMHLGATGNKRTHSMSEGAPNSYANFAQNVAPQASMFGTLPPGTQQDHVQFTPDEKDALTAYANSEYKLLFPAAFANEDELQILIGASTAPIRQGFFMALRAVLLLVSNDREPSITVYRHLMDIAIGPASLTPLANVAYLQSIVLALYVLSYSGHPSSQPVSASYTGLLGIASGIVSHLNIQNMNVEKIQVSKEEAVIYMSGRRALWSLVVLAQWDATAMGSLRQMTYDDLTITKGDNKLLGSTWYALASMTIPLNGILTSLRTTKNSTEDSLLIANNAKRFSEQLELIDGNMTPLPDMPSANAMFLAMKMITLRYGVNYTPYVPDAGAVAIANQAIDILAAPYAGDFPLSHHVAALAVRNCVEAVGFKAVKEEAKKGLEKMLGAIEGGTALRHNGWKESIVRACKEKLDSLGGLQHLANAAVGATEGEGKEDGIDVTSVLKEGYLKVLVP